MVLPSQAPLVQERYGIPHGFFCPPTGDLSVPHEVSLPPDETLIFLPVFSGFTHIPVPVGWFYSDSLFLPSFFLELFIFPSAIGLTSVHWAAGICPIIPPSHPVFRERWFPRCVGVPFLFEPCLWFAFFLGSGSLLVSFPEFDLSLSRFLFLL